MSRADVKPLPVQSSLERASRRADRPPQERSAQAALRITTTFARGDSLLTRVRR
jgi:hypothetical protein